MWFLALHLSEPWQWPVIVAMITVGAAMLGVAIALPRRLPRRHAGTEREVIR